MSVVHDNLSRQDPGHAQPGPLVVQAGAEDRAADDISRFEREIARKERLLTEGIRQLQHRVRELTEGLEAARTELEQEREDNMCLRQGAMSDAMSSRRGTEKPEPSLLSRALS